MFEPDSTSTSSTQFHHKKGNNEQSACMRESAHGPPLVTIPRYQVAKELLGNKPTHSQGQTEWDRMAGT